MRSQRRKIAGAQRHGVSTKKLSPAKRQRLLVEASETYMSGAMSLNDFEKAERDVATNHRLAVGGLVEVG